MERSIDHEDLQLLFGRMIPAIGSGEFDKKGMWCTKCSVGSCYSIRFR